MPEEVKNTALQKEYQAIDRQYQRDVAIVEARPLISRLVFFAWLVLDIGLIAFFVVVIGTYLSSGMFTDARNMATLGYNSAATRAVSAAQTPEALTLGGARVISSGGNHDVVAVVENPNTSWYAEFTYFFSFDGGESEKEEGFVLPGSKTTFTAFNLNAPSTPRNARLIIEDLHWRRVDRHAISDIESWLEDRSAFPVSDIVYTNNIGFNGASVGQTDFSLTNRTAYSFWEPKFLVFLERSSTIVAVTEVTVGEFLAGETREINVRWFDPLPVSATIRVVPVINYFDESLYMEPEE